MNSRIFSALLALSFVACKLTAQPQTDSATTDDAVVANPHFHSVAAKLDMGGTSYFYTNLEGTVDSVVAFAQPFTAVAPQAAAIAGMVESGIRKLGLDQLTDYGHSAIALKSGMSRHKTYVGLKQRSGLFALAGGEPRELAALNYVPADAAAVWCGNFEFGKVLPLVRDVATAVMGPGGRGMLDQVIDNASKQVGFEIPKVAASLGDEWSVYLKVPDASADAKSGDKESVILVARLKVTSDDVASAARRLLSREHKVEQVAGESDLPIWTLQEKSGSKKEKFYLGTPKDWIVLSNDQAELARSEKTAAGASGNVLSAPELKKLAPGLPKQINSLNYIGPAYVEFSKKTMSRALEKMKEDKGTSGSDAAKVQALAQAAQKSFGQTALMQPNVGWRVNDANGMQWVQIGGVSASPTTMMTAAAVGIGAAVAVPAFFRARDNSRVAAFQENLTKLDGAKEQWALEYKKKNGDTVTKEDLKDYLKKWPECPAGGHYTLNPIGTNPTCDYKGPHAEKHKLQ
jgi:hypothetical protein